jgi:predicted nucleotidyltransferase
MKEMTMLGLDRVDLDELCAALEDNAPEHEWFLDALTGELEFRSEYLDDSSEDWDADERELVLVDPIGSPEAYADMEELIETVSDRRPRELLERAIAGRGAFRRFKDTLFEFPELGEAWFRFHDARIRRRALSWLRDRELISAAEAERALGAIAEPEGALLAGALDAIGLARSVAGELRAMYGNRLKNVLLFGSWARGDAHPESDVDLLVALDEVQSRSSELARMDSVMWRLSLANDTVITEIPVSESEFRESDAPVLVRARKEGVPVG